MVAERHIARERISYFERPFEFFGVISIVIASDLMRGTGRFNLAQGLTALATGAGAAGSQLLGGFVVQAFGYRAGFLALAGIAATALVFFALFMPETKPHD